MLHRLISCPVLKAWPPEYNSRDGSEVDFERWRPPDGTEIECAFFLPFAEGLFHQE